MNLAELAREGPLLKFRNRVPGYVKPAGDVDRFEPTSLAPPPNRRSSLTYLFAPLIKRHETCGIFIL